MAPRFRFTLTNAPDLKNGDHDVASSTTHQIFMRQDATKSSSFYLNPRGAEGNDEEEKKDAVTAGTINSENMYYCVDKPAQLFIDCPIESNPTISNDNTKQTNDVSIISSTAPFLFGGLELISNSRTVEVYTTDRDGKETYLLTCRGAILQDRDSIHPIEMRCNEGTPNIEWFICVIVHPLGPSEITNLKLKLLSLRSPKEKAFVQDLKLKGKLPIHPIPLHPERRHSNPNLKEAGQKKSTLSTNMDRVRMTMSSMRSTLATVKKSEKNLQSQSKSVSPPMTKMYEATTQGLSKSSSALELPASPPNPKSISFEAKRRMSSLTTSTTVSSELPNRFHSTATSMPSSSAESNMSPSDLGMAMTTISAMSTSIEDRLNKKIKEESNAIQQNLLKKMNVLERQNSMLHNLILAQGTQIQMLLRAQDEEKKRKIQKAEKRQQELEEEKKQKEENTQKEKEKQDKKNFTNDVENEETTDTKKNIDVMKDHLEMMKEFWREEKNELLKMMLEQMKNLTSSSEIESSKRRGFLKQNNAIIDEKDKNFVPHNDDDYYGDKRDGNNNCADERLMFNETIDTDGDPYVTVITDESEGCNQEYTMAKNSSTTGDNSRNFRWSLSTKTSDITFNTVSWSDKLETRDAYVPDIPTTPEVENSLNGENPMIKSHSRSGINSNGNLDKKELGNETHLDNEGSDNGKNNDSGDLKVFADFLDPFSNLPLMDKNKNDTFDLLDSQADLGIDVSDNNAIDGKESNIENEDN